MSENPWLQGYQPPSIISRSENSARHTRGYNYNNYDNDRRSRSRYGTRHKSSRFSDDVRSQLMSPSTNFHMSPPSRDVPITYPFYSIPTTESSTSADTRQLNVAYKTYEISHHGRSPTRSRLDYDSNYRSNYPSGRSPIRYKYRHDAQYESTADKQSSKFEKTTNETTTDQLPSKPDKTTITANETTTDKLPTKLDKTAILKLVTSTTKYEPAIQKLLREKRSQLTQDLRNTYNEKQVRTEQPDIEITDGIIPNYTIDSIKGLEFLLDEGDEVKRESVADEPTYNLGHMEIPSNVDELQLPTDVSSLFNFTEIVGDVQSDSKGFNKVQVDLNLSPIKPIGKQTEPVYNTQVEKNTIEILPTATNRIANVDKPIESPNDNAAGDLVENINKSTTNINLNTDSSKNKTANVKLQIKNNNNIENMIEEVVESSNLIEKAQNKDEPLGNKISEDKDNLKENSNSMTSQLGLSNGDRNLSENDTICTTNLKTNKKASKKNRQKTTNRKQKRVIKVVQQQTDVKNTSFQQAVARMHEIDVQIDKLMQEKFQLYEILNQSCSNHPCLPNSSQNQQVQKNLPKDIEKNSSEEKSCNKKINLEKKNVDTHTDSDDYVVIQRKRRRVLCSTLSDQTSTDENNDAVTKYNIKPCSVVITKIEHLPTSAIDCSNKVVNDDVVIKCDQHRGSILFVKALGRTLLAAGEDGNLYKYSISTGKLLVTGVGHKAAVTTFISADLEQERVVFSGALDSALLCFTFNELKQIKKVEMDSPIQSMDYNWRIIFIGTMSGHIRRYDVNKGSIDDERYQVSKQSVLAVKATTEGSRRVLIIAPRNQEISIRDAHTGLLLRQISSNTPPLNVYSILLTQSVIYCGNSGTTIFGYAFTDGTVVAELVAGRGAVCLIEYKQLLFAGCYDGCVYVFDLLTKGLLYKSAPAGGMVLSLDVTDDKIFIGCKNNCLKIQCLPAVVRTYLNNIRS